jgi:hypothetical protein
VQARPDVDGIMSLELAGGLYRREGQARTTDTVNTRTLSSVRYLVY